MQFNPWPRSVGEGPGVAMGYGVSCRHGWDLVWLGCRLVAAAPIQPLARELPYAMGVALEKKKRKKPKGPYQEKTEKQETPSFPGNNFNM